MFLGHLLTNFLERELVSETLNVTENTLTSYYMVRSKRKVNNSAPYKLKYDTVYNYSMIKLRNKI